MALNYQGVTPINQANRYSFASSKTIKVTQPNLIKNYSENMGETDRMGQNIAYYCTSLRSKKWYWPLFIWGLDVSVQNAWLLYRKIRENVANEPEMDLHYSPVTENFLADLALHSMQKRVACKRVDMTTLDTWFARKIREHVASCVPQQQIKNVSNVISLYMKSVFLNYHTK